MADEAAPLLSDVVVEQVREIASGIRDGRVAPLVGAGLSRACGLAGWEDLMRRMILAWQSWDTSRKAKVLSSEDYLKLFRTTFGSDLAVISYLRNPKSSGKRPAFADLLYSALYWNGNVSDPGELVTPEPRQTHRHIIELFPDRIWTTNYDDLLEEAARQANWSVRTLHPGHRLENHGLSVAHLHGFLSPPTRQQVNPSIDDSSVILAEDDYHQVASNVIGWTNREFYRLFDGHQALILGMSLDDPNLRRVLRFIGGQSRSVSDKKHFAVVRPIGVSSSINDPVFKKADYAAANKERAWYWKQRGVELVEIPNHESLLPFLMRLRYETYGTNAGDLWKYGAKICAEINPWMTVHQGYARASIADGIQELCRDFDIGDSSEIVEVGLFLLRDEGRELELAFRGGVNDVRAVQGELVFSTGPDQPTGVAGRVFASSDFVRISRNHPLYDYGLDGSQRKRQHRTDYEGLISVPLIDWQKRGVPLGVIYITTTTIDGMLFHLPDDSTQSSQSRTLQDLYVWLHTWGLKLLSTMHRQN